MKILVSLKRKWGKELFYPVSEDAVFIAQLTGRPTILKNQLKLMKDRGWEVSITQEPVDIKKILDGDHDER